MMGPGIVWAAGGYLGGTFPSTWLVARAKGASDLMERSGRSSSETDPHILMMTELGVGWTAFAATLDVLKGLLFVLAARHLGDLNRGWLATAALAVVVGHSFPFYAKQMAGRGLAASAGVYLALLPVEMSLAGALIVVGGALRATGLAATLGMAGVPTVAALRGQPGEFVGLGVAIFGVLMIRRLEGVGENGAKGVPRGRAIMYRCLFDSSGPPPGTGVWDARREEQAES
jgi:glycerol-3-phosphate acyltransferase PlsY